MNARPSKEKKSLFTDDFARALEDHVKATDDLIQAEHEKLERAAEALEAQIQEFAAEFVSERRDDPELERLRQLYAGAQQEVQALERRCEELARGRRKPSTEPRVVGGHSFNWEQQKQNMIASLDGPDDQGEEETDRLTIDGAISITDALILEKDREIVELRRLLEEAKMRESVATPNAEILEIDEIIRAERARLDKLDTELQEKMRAAEIEISMERAALARERAELEETRQLLEQGREGPGSTSSDTAKPARGRWLARLGLKSDETYDQ